MGGFGQVFASGSGDSGVGALVDGGGDDSYTSVTEVRATMVGGGLTKATANSVHAAAAGVREVQVVQHAAQGGTLGGHGELRDLRATTATTGRPRSPVGDR